MNMWIRIKIKIFMVFVMKLKKFMTLSMKHRNYVTSKPFSENKIKINFNHYQLAEGWDENKEKDNLSIILIKDDEYYLGIFNIKNKSFKEMSSETLTPAKTDKIYKKIRYKSFNPIKGIPKCVFTKDVKEHFEKSKDSYVFKASDNKGLFIRDFVISYDDYLTNFTSDHQKLETKKYQKAFERWADLCIRFLKSYKSTANYNL